MPKRGRGFHSLSRKLQEQESKLAKELDVIEVQIRQQECFLKENGKDAATDTLLQVLNKQQGHLYIQHQIVAIREALMQKNCGLNYTILGGDSAEEIEAQIDKLEQLLKDL